MSDPLRSSDEKLDEAHTRNLVAAREFFSGILLEMEKPSTPERDARLRAIALAIIDVVLPAPECAND